MRAEAPRRPSALARQIAVETGLVIFFAMLAYAIFQYLTGQHSPLELLLRHLWHSVVLGLVVYVTLLWRLRHLVLEPLRAVTRHGRELMVGRFVEHDYPRAHNEIDEVGAMMNRMAAHLHTLQGTCWEDYARSMDRHITEVRRQANVSPDVLSDLSSVRRELERLETAARRFSICQGEAPRHPVIVRSGE